MSILRGPFIIALSGALLFGVALSLRINFLAPKVEPQPPIQNEVQLTLKERAAARQLEAEFRAIPLEGKAAVVWSVDSQRVLFGRYINTQLPLASLTKIMLAYTGNQMLADSARVTITGRDLAEEGSSGLKPGEVFLYKDLRSAMLVASLNDAANAISRSIAESVRDGNGNPHIAIDLMNASARRLGLSQTVFYNEDGLDIGKEQSGAVGSAEDVAKVFSALLSEYPETLAPTRLDGYALRSLGGNIYQYWNTNQHLADIPGALGSKTGYTTLADGNLAVALKKGEKTFVIVLLGSSKEGRFQDVSRIARFLSEHTLSSLFEEHDIVGAS